MELLAPAGTMENFMAALEAGADAVYLGGKAFSARAKAGNFTQEELAECVRMAHILGAAIHVTVNILVGDREMKELEKYLRELEALGVDAIIVQDLAVAELAQRVAPRMQLHASTQLTAANLGTVKFLQKLGFSRVVLARELSLPEIKHICAEADCEIEIFIHGALCICYSGQCLMSSFMGGRSGNRGACAQPCRLPYELLDGKGKALLPPSQTYIMSPKDLNYSDHMEELIAAGVTSCKIEGRMKKVSYVRQVVQAYRSIIDQAGKAKAQDKSRLSEGFNRGFSAAYLEGNPGRAMMTIAAPNNQGKEIGHSQLKGNTCMLQLSEEVSIGSLLKIISSAGEVVYVTISEEWQAKRPTAGGKGLFSYSRSNAGEGQSGTVYLAAPGRPEEKRKGLASFTRKHPVYAFLDGREGEPVSLTLLADTGESATVSDEYCLTRALKEPTSPAKVEGQLNRLGNTLFTLQLTTMPDGPYMWPASVLNELRRKAVAELEEVFLQNYEAAQYGSSGVKREKEKGIIASSAKSIMASSAKSTITSSAKSTIASSAKGIIDSGTKDLVETGASKITDCFSRSLPKLLPAVSVRTDELEQVEAALAAGAGKVIFGGDRLNRRPYTPEVFQKVTGLCRQQGAYLTFASPRVVRDSETEAYQGELADMLDASPDAVSIHFTGMLEWLHERGYRGAVEGDTGLNIFNTPSAELLEKWNFSSIALSQEATLSQISRIASAVTIPLECMVQGETELMISEYCPIAAFCGNGTKQNCPRPCLKDQFALQDRKGESFPIRTDPRCRIHIMNGRELDMSPYVQELTAKGVKLLRIEGRQRSSDWIRQMVKRYTELLQGDLVISNRETEAHITRGHYFRGIF